MKKKRDLFDVEIGFERGCVLKICPGVAEKSWLCVESLVDFINLLVTVLSYQTRSLLLLLFPGVCVVLDDGDATELMLLLLSPRRR